MRTVWVCGLVLTFAGTPLAPGAVGGLDSGSAPHWLPGEPFDKYAWIKVNSMRDPFTGKEYPPVMPPNGSVVANVSVVNKLAGDLTVDIISLAVLHLQVWFPKEPTKPVTGEVKMSSKNGTLNSNEWRGEIGGGGADGRVWPLPECTRVYWYVRIWDLANREINSSNSLAASAIQNFTVGGSTRKCLFEPGARFQEYFEVEQAPFNATDPGPKHPAETKPGGAMPSGTTVRVHLIPRKWVQMPWVILYVNQSTTAGEFNSSWLVGVRGYCRDFTISPNACDVSGEKENPDLPVRNGTEFVFDLPGFHAGTYIEYSLLAVDHSIPDYSKDPDYLADPWSFTVAQRFCEPRPQSCLGSPDFYYRVPPKPPPPICFCIGRLVAQLLVEVDLPSGKPAGLAYDSDGCVQFGNDTWHSSVLRTNEYGLAVSPTIEVRPQPPDFRPVRFWAKAWRTCGDAEGHVIESKDIPNTDGPDFTVNATFIIIFGGDEAATYPEDVTGWPGLTYAYVYGITMIAFIVPTLALGLRWFLRKKEAEGEKRAEAESRFKV